MQMYGIFHIISKSMGIILGLCPEYACVLVTFSLESLWVWSIETAVLAPQRTQAASLDEAVEVFLCQVGGTLAQLFHL